MASNIAAKKIILQKSFLTKFRQFSSSSSSVADGIQKKSDRIHQPKVSSSKLNDFFFVLASKYDTDQGTPSFFSALTGALKQVLTTEGPIAPASWTWRFKTDTAIHFGKKIPEPEKLDVTTKLSPEGLVIIMELADFKEDNLKLSVEKNYLFVLGNAEISGDSKLLAEHVEINPEYLFDAEKVTAELVDGYLKVTFPKGTNDTMVTKPFYVKWA